MGANERSDKSSLPAKPVDVSVIQMNPGMFSHDSIRSPEQFVVSVEPWYEKTCADSEGGRQQDEHELPSPRTRKRSDPENRVETSNVTQQYDPEVDWKADVSWWVRHPSVKRKELANGR